MNHEKLQCNLVLKNFHDTESRSVNYTSKSKIGVTLTVHRICRRTNPSQAYDNVYEVNMKLGIL